VTKIITIPNKYDVIEDLTGRILSTGKNDSYIMFDNGEKCYIPNECFKINKTLRKKML